MSNRRHRPLLAVALAAVACGPAGAAPIAPAEPRPTSPIAPTESRPTSVASPASGAPAEGAPDLAVAPLDPASAPATATVTVRASSAASRQPEQPRTLRRLVAWRGGRVQLARGYTRVSLMVTEIVSGTLDDPDYARRPVGVNTLPVVLLDEAADAAPDGLDGFAGTWTLTRLPDGTLVVARIADTPFPAANADRRRKVHEVVTKGLRARFAGDRIDALAELESHPFLDLVPSAVALLDDAKPDDRPPVPPGRGTARPATVRDAAEHALRALVEPLADPKTPGDASRASWDAFWKDLSARPAFTAPPAVATGPDVALLRIAMNQTALQAAAAGDDRVVLGVSRLQQPIDGFTSGIAVGRASGGALRWAMGVRGSGDEPDGLDAAVGPAGTGVLWADGGDVWRLALVPPAALVASDAVQAPPPSVVDRGARHAAIARAGDGWVLAATHEAPARLDVARLDASGRARGRPRRVALPSPPSTSYHRGVHPLAVAGGARPLVALETEGRLTLVALDEGLGVRAAIELADTGGLVEPALAAGRDRTLVAWRSDGRPSRVQLALVDDAARLVAPVQSVGADVDGRVRAIALDDGGFAVAWLEAEREIFVLRFDAAGRAGTPVLAVRGELARGTLGLGRDGDALFVLYEDRRTYPFTVRTKRLAAR